MKIIIEIECETIQDFRDHLRLLSNQIISKAEKLNLSHYSDEFTDGLDLSDANYNGNHKVTILPE